MSTFPQFIFLAKPARATRIPTLLEKGPVQDILEHPGELRHAGWSLETRQQAKIVKGEYLEVSIQDYKKLQLYEDGTLIARVSGGDNFMGWGRNDDEFTRKPRLNSLALVEVTYSFADLYRQLLPHITPKAEAHLFQLSIRNATIGVKRIYLNPYGIETSAWMTDDPQYPAPDDTFDREVLISSEIAANDPAHTAYILVEKIYLWFGLPTNVIPYIVETDGIKRVDLEKIKRGGKDSR